VGWDLLLDPRRRQWILALLVPAVIWGTWYLTLGRTGIATHGDPFTPDRYAAVPTFVFRGLAEAFGAATGGGAAIGAVLIVGIVILITYLAVRRRPIPGRAIACVLAIATVYVIVGLVRSQLGVDATVYTRYTYLTGILALVCLASLVGRPAITTRQQPWAFAACSLVLIISLGWNLQLLVAGRNLFAERADLTRALVVVGTSDPLPAGVDPERSLVLVPSPTELRRITATYGSPLADELAPAFVPPVSSDALEEALRRAQNPPDWLLELESAP
jgi:hypothetical protein